MELDTQCLPRDSNKNSQTKLAMNMDLDTQSLPRDSKQNSQTKLARTERTLFQQVFNPGQRAQITEEAAKESSVPNPYHPLILKAQRIKNSTDFFYWKLPFLF